MQTKIKKLESVIGYRFKNKELMEFALTHPSYESKRSYERLEFLGDLVLDAIVGINLFSEYPDAEESFLTDLKSAYVNSKYLHNAGVTMKLEKFIRYRNCEVPRLDNFIEGIIGAVYLDSGWKKAEVLIKKIILNKKIEPIRNFKNILSTLSKRHFQIEPAYSVVSEKGLPHKKIYNVKVKIEGRKYVGRGSAGTKKDAEMQAAEDLLRKLEKYRKIKHERPPNS